MITFCEYYMPNNDDFIIKGYCLLHDKKCKYKGRYPELTRINARQQKQCPDFKEWIDPLEN